jgi:hypothetical protein
MEVLKSGLFYKMSGQDKIIKKLLMAKTNVINEAWQDDEVSGLLLLTAWAARISSKSN